MDFKIAIFILLIGTSCQKEDNKESGVVGDPWYMKLNLEPYEIEMLKISPETLTIDSNTLRLSSQISIKNSKNIYSSTIEHLSCSSLLKEIDGLPSIEMFPLEQYVILNDSVWQGRVAWNDTGSLIFTEQFILNYGHLPDVAPKWRPNLYVDVVVLLAIDSSRYYIQDKHVLLGKSQ